MTSPDQIEHVAKILATAESVVAFTGAGVSQESVATYRDAQTGLWERYHLEDLATPSAFQKNPQLVWSWYVHRLLLVNAALPNQGHLALADLALQLPKIVVITQNIDDLHERAGSTDVIHLHGRLGKFRCSQNCQGARSMVELGPPETSLEPVPLCPTCGSHVRPDVVWFGERLEPEPLSRSFELASHCDVMFVIGTSGVVQPAFQLPVRATQGGAKVFVINPMLTDQLATADGQLQAPSGEALPALVKALNIQLGRG